MLANFCKVRRVVFSSLVSRLNSQGRRCWDQGRRCWDLTLSCGHVVPYAGSSPPAFTSCKVCLFA